MKYSCFVTVCTSPTDSSRSQPLIIGFGSSENNSPPRANAVWRRRTRRPDHCDCAGVRPSARQPKGARTIPIFPRGHRTCELRAPPRRERRAVADPRRGRAARSVRGSSSPAVPPSGNPRAMRPVTRPGGGRSARRRRVRSCVGASEARGARVRCSRRLRRASRRGDGSRKSAHFFSASLAVFDADRPAPLPPTQVAAMTEVNTTTSSPLVGAIGKIKESAMHVFSQVRPPSSSSSLLLGTGPRGVFSRWPCEPSYSDTQFFPIAADANVQP